MPISPEFARALVSLVGTPYERMNCWRLVQFAYATAGLSLPDDYYAALRLFRTLSADEDPEPGDVVVMRNHPIVTNHVGVYLGERQFIHSIEETNVCVTSLDRAPWTHAGRVVGFLRLRT